MQFSNLLVIEQQISGQSYKQMKARSQRTHLMGVSNRDQRTFESNNIFKTQSVFQRSFQKSKSLANRLPSLAASLPPTPTKQSNGDSRKNPFSGFHHEFQTQRFDKSNIRPFKYSQTPIPKQQPALRLAPTLNKEIKSIREEFQGKRINMQKLSELKKTFVTNNKERKNLNEYFQKYATNGVIDDQGLRKIVKEYGYDISEDETKLMFALTHHSNNSEKRENHLKIDGFVELMTKDDIFFKTLDLKPVNQGDMTFGTNFTEKVHLILRNKFINLKEALNIYISRNEEVGPKEFSYVMRKLDLTGLVLTQKEREGIFKKYSNEKGKLNVEGLLCAIVEQENYGNNKGQGPFSGFMDEIKVNEEQIFHQEGKYRQFSLGHLSVLEYELQFKKAKTVIDQLLMLRKKKKHNHEDATLYAPNLNDGVISHSDVIATTEKILKREGVNFHKDDYEAFAAYLNYDANGNIAVDRLNYFVFDESEEEARERFERRARREVPNTQKETKEEKQLGTDKDSAVKSLQKIWEHKLASDTSELFKLLDSDKDGHISKQQFGERVRRMNVVSEWEIENLAAYLGLSKDGSINFHDFGKKMEQSGETLINSKSLEKSGEWPRATQLKKTIINDSKFAAYQHPTRHSAWPVNLTSQDLSLLQPPKDSGMYISEGDRFGQRKEEFGMKQKQETLMKAENRVKKIAEWNKVMDERNQAENQKVEEKAAVKNYKSKLAMEKYEFDCHQ